VIYLANPSTPPVREAMLANPYLGAMVTPSQGNLVAPSIPVGIDNGCFAQPEKFDADQFIAKIEKFPPNQVLFVNAPDVVGDWEATLSRSEEWLHYLEHAGYPPCVVLQDGATVDTVPYTTWKQVDAVFIGGTTEFKLGADAAELAIKARRDSKWVHMGRVNSLKRIRYADTIGCHSADGTFITFGPNINLPKVLAWLADVNRTPERKLPCL
jgi:hypothetical protein